MSQGQDHSDPARAATELYEWWLFYLSLHLLGQSFVLYFPMEGSWSWEFCSLITSPPQLKWVKSDLGRKGKNYHFSQVQQQQKIVWKENTVREFIPIYICTFHYNITCVGWGCRNDAYLEGNIKHIKHYNI